MPDSPLSNINSSSEAAATRRPKWENARTDTLRNDPQAMLICDGLLAMCRTSDGKCEIGVLGIPANGDPLLANHHPEITVIRVDSHGTPVSLLRKRWNRESPDFSQATLSITDPQSGHETPRFFLRDSADAKDFRKGIDLEHDLNNGNTLSIKRDAFRPRLTVHHGDFYSLLLTPEHYIASPVNHSGQSFHLGRLAYLTAANFHCNANGEIVLKFSDGPEPRIHRWPVSEGKIFIIVHNNCQENGRKCIEERPDGTTDFHLYYQAIHNPAPYQVTCAYGGIPTPPRFGDLDRDVYLALVVAGIIPENGQHELEKHSLELADPSLGAFFSTNPTPCGIASFGEGESLGGS